MSNPKTPSERQAEARKALGADLNLLPDCDCGAEVMLLIDAYARACIDEAVAPALEYIDEVLTRAAQPEEQFRVRHLRKLLTERAGT